MKKVLFWTPLYWPDIGGIELMSRRHVLSLLEREYEFIVLTSQGKSKGPEMIRLDDTVIYRFPIIKALKTKDLPLMHEIQKEIVRIKQSFRPDLIHLNFGGPAPISFFHLKSAEAAPAPLLVALHGSLLMLKGNEGTILGKLLNSAKWITACSHSVLEDAQKVAPEISTNSSVVYYGLPEPDRKPEPISFDSPHILALGRLVEEKGFDLAITAFAELKSSIPEASLTIAGDGPARCQLEKLVDELNLNHSIHFVGEISPDNVYDLINTAAVIIVPSRYREAFGLVALEASQMARPVVASNVGGLREVVVHGKTGLLVEKENAKAIADAIKCLIEHPDKTRQIGQKGRIRARSQFNWEKYIDNYDKLYKKLLEMKDENQAR